MTREERLQQIARELFEVNEGNKEGKQNREKLISEFYRLLDAGFKGRDHILPVKTIEVPDAFWNSTQMSKDEFVESRFPGWNVEHVEKNITTGKTVLILKRDPSYLGSVVEVETEDGNVKVAKEIAEFTPEIDWDTLNAERPDLFEKLAIYKTVVELNDAALERIAMETPEELAVLERHMRVKKPTLKVTSRRLKDGKS
jgi:hypothetical protein